MLTIRANTYSLDFLSQAPCGGAFWHRRCDTIIIRILSLQLHE